VFWGGLSGFGTVVGGATEVHGGGPVLRGGSFSSMSLEGGVCRGVLWERVSQSLKLGLEMSEEVCQ